MLDLIIRGGTVVDGTGEAGRVADIGVRDGRIVAIGEISEDATETVDATGMVVCPGFVDPHTHYDAQLFWDPYASPSNLHGITSVIMGNCGFTLAPLGDDSDGHYLKMMMTKVEGMALEALDEGVPWNWRTFAEYMDRLDGNLGVNVGAMVGHCAIRRTVMKDDSVKGEATAEQIAEMKALLVEGLDAGAIGFSTGRSFTHNDADGIPVPSRWASEDEVIELCAAVKDYEGTSLEWVADGCMNGFTDEETSLMTRMSLAGERPLNWNVLTIDSARPEEYEHQLDACEKAAEQGAKVIALTMPILVGMNMSLRTYCALFMLPGWKDVLGLPQEEKMEKLRDPQTLIDMELAAASPEAGVFARLTGWGRYRVGDTYSPANDGLKGRLVADIARERGVRDFQCLVEISLADELRTVWWPGPTDDDLSSWKMRQAAWEHDNVMIGGSDAGAHLDRMAGAAYTTQWLEDSLHGQQLISMERAIHHMTDVPARLFGLRERGRLEEGWHADIVIFDPEKVGATEFELVHDLPGDSPRLYAAAKGIQSVYVNGVKTVQGGDPTGALPGVLFRNGRDTETSPIPAAQG